MDNELSNNTSSNQNINYNTIHKRLAHANEQMINRTIKSTTGYTGKIIKIGQVKCEPCQLGKQRSRNIPTLSKTSVEPLDIIDSDCQGPFPIIGRDGSKYNIKFIDVSSGFSKVYPIITIDSDTTLDRFKDFKTRLELRTNLRYL